MQCNSNFNKRGRGRGATEAIIYSLNPPKKNMNKNIFRLSLVLLDVTTKCKCVASHVIGRYKVKVRFVLFDARSTYV